METKSIVQTSANVIRIVNLKKGDIYKRYEDSNYGDDKVMYGIVKDVANNGDNTFIEVTEFSVSYSAMKASTKVFGGEKDLAIFPASIEDLQEDFGKCAASTQRDIEKKEEEVVELKKALQTTESLLSGEMQKELSTPLFKEMGQSEFNQKKLEQQSQSV